MADGYARVTKRPAVAQVHSAVGLGNSMALLYQAHRSFTPMVVIAGEVDTRLQAFDGFLGGDLVNIARPVTKWAERILHGEQLLRVWQRAIKVAMTPPQGPVFLALPMNVLDEEVESDIQPTQFVNWRSVPTSETLDVIAQRLSGAVSPLFLVGDGVSLAGAQEEVRRLSEWIGAPVFGVDFADLNASFRDPMFQGLLGHSFGSQTRKITLQADVLVAIGTPLFPELFPSLQPYLQENALLIQIDLNPWELSKNYPAHIAVLADPKATLDGLLSTLASRWWGPAQQARADQRTRQWSVTKQQEHANRQQLYDSVRDRVPIPPSRVAEVIVESLPTDVLVYDESITSTDELLHYLQPSDPRSYFLGRGGCLGVGWPGAVGAKLAQPHRPVLAISADGSALFVLQTLWTAAHYNLGIVFLVLNNHSYRILKVNLLHYWAQSGVALRPFPHMDLDKPRIRFDKLAEAFGVYGTRAEDAKSLRVALDEAFRRTGPSLIDVDVDGSVAEEVRELIRSHSGCA
jgi:benzoylformate decarboxylase